MRVDIHNHFYPGTYLQQLEALGRGVRIGADAQGRRYIEEGGSRLVTLTQPMVDLDARMTVSYVMNQMLDQSLGDYRSLGIVMAAYEGL